MGMSPTTSPRANLESVPPQLSRRRGSLPVSTLGLDGNATAAMMAAASTPGGLVRRSSAIDQSGGLVPLVELKTLPPIQVDFVFAAPY